MNRELAYPLKKPEINNFQQAQQMYWYQFNAYIKKTQRVRAHAAKYWILLAVFFCMLFYEFSIHNGGAIGINAKQIARITAEGDVSGHSHINVAGTDDPKGGPITLSFTDA